MKSMELPTPFIAVEDMDGAGKTMLLRRLENTLRLMSDHLYGFFRELGGSDFGEIQRDIFLDPRFQDKSLKTKLVQLFAARNSNIEKIVMPSREGGRIVIADRFDGSTLAYQVFAEARSYEERAKLENLFWVLRKAVVNDENAPTLYRYLDLPPEVAHTRRVTDVSRDKNHYDEKPADFYARGSAQGTEPSSTKYASGVPRKSPSSMRRSPRTKSSTKSSASSASTSAPTNPEKQNRPCQPTRAVLFIVTLQTSR